MLKRQPLSSCHASRGGFCAPWHRSVGVRCKTWQSPLASLPKCGALPIWGGTEGRATKKPKPSIFPFIILVSIGNILLRFAHPFLEYSVQ